MRKNLELTDINYNSHQFYKIENKFVLYLFSILFLQKSN